MLRFLIIISYLLFFSNVALAKDYTGLMKDLEKAYVLLDSIKFSNNSKMISSMTLTQEDKKYLKKTIINQKKRVLYLLNKLKKK